MTNNPSSSSGPETTASRHYLDAYACKVAITRTSLTCSLLTAWLRESTSKVLWHAIQPGTLDFAVSEAGDGQEALDRCRQAVPDVILLDWNMPVMSGIEFLRELDGVDLPHRPKVVFCTTENGVAHIRAAIDAGADEYVMKPFDRETLRSKFALVGVA